ncbi:MAG: 50S ribosomal protein P1 [archaeon]
MEYVYAALLLNSAGKEINEETLTKVVESTGSEVDEAKIKSLTTALEDVDIEEAVKKQAVAQAAPAKTETAEKTEDEEEDEEEEEEEVSEEEAAEGLGSLFE